VETCAKTCRHKIAERMTILIIRGGASYHAFWDARLYYNVITRKQNQDELYPALAQACCAIRTGLIPAIPDGGDEYSGPNAVVHTVQVAQTQE